MTKNMRSLTGHTSVHHDGKLYVPNKKGVFEIDDAHLAALQSHGLMLEDAADAAATAALTAKRMEGLEEENAKLKQQLQESALAQENETLRAQLADMAAGKRKKPSEKTEG